MAMIKASKRLKSVSTYYFSEKLKQIEHLKSIGKPIINLAIGNPDLGPPKNTLVCFEKALKEPNSHKYQSYQGIFKLRQAMAKFYKKHYSVDLDAQSEILPLMGAKEGIMHISMAFTNPKDQVYFPNPGYITYGSVARLMDLEGNTYRLTEKNHWQPSIEDLKITPKTRIIWLNYPHMPTGAPPKKSIIEELVWLAHKHKILLVNDNPYSLILNNKKPFSIFQIDGAKDIAIELNSTSKSFGMAGCRVGMACGAAKNINRILQVKSNMDSGMFYPVQIAAAKALKTSKNWLKKRNEVYKNRKRLVKKIAHALALSPIKKSQGLFVWARLPNDYAENSIRFCDDLLDDQNIFIAPGNIFGDEGTRYVRFSLCQPEDVLEKILKRISKK